MTSEEKHLTSIHRRFTMTYSYGLHFTKDLFNPNNPLLIETIQKQFPNREEVVKLLFVIDENVHHSHPTLKQKISDFCDQHTLIQFQNYIIVDAGETSKNEPSNLEKVIHGIDEFHICRHSLVIGIGGGAVIDMVGYAATISHRGIGMIRIPTTVLAQNDAAVGVKNSINYLGKKNFLGTFAPPVAIINDSLFLETLSDRDWIAGISEAIKVAIIKDEKFFNYISEQAENLKNRNEIPMRQLIHRCAEIHMDHISENGDPFEKGSSRPLDFGHWAAHKMEQMTNFSIRHGEAVAIGMAIDCTYSHLLGFLKKKDLTIILDTIKACGFSLTLPFKEKGSLKELLVGLQEFREHLGGQLTITLTEKIGSKFDVHEIEEDKMLSALETLLV